MEISQDDIIQKYATLPRVAQDMLASDKAATLLVNLKNKHRLHFDQIDAINREIMITVLGLQPAQNFVGDIEKKAHLPHETAIAVAKEINASLLAPLREQLKQRPPENTPEEQEVDSETSSEELESVAFGSLETELPESVFTRNQESSSPPQEEEPTETHTPQTNEEEEQPNSIPRIEEQRLHEAMSVPKQERTISEIREKLPSLEKLEPSEEDSPAAKQYPGDDPYREPLS